MPGFYSIFGVREGSSCTVTWRFNNFTAQPILSVPQSSGFLDYPNFFSRSNLIMDIY